MLISEQIVEMCDASNLIKMRSTNKTVNISTFLIRLILLIFMHEIINLKANTKF